MLQDMVALCLTIRANKSNQLPSWLGRATQAFFLSSLEQLSPNISASVHDGSGMKPFTASTLLGAVYRGDTTNVNYGQTFEVRYTTLHPQLSTLMLQALVPMWEQDGVMLHDQSFTVTGVDTDTQTNPWAGCASFDQLLKTASPERKIIKLTFAAPTAFKSTRGHFVPLPQPELVFGSLLDRWNSFSHIKLPDSLYSVFHEEIAIDYLHVRSEEVRFGGGKWEQINGFTGEVSYRIMTKNPEFRRCINALAAFARYSGVGVKTTSGLGQLRVD